MKSCVSHEPSGSAASRCRKRAFDIILHVGKAAHHGLLAVFPHQTEDFPFGHAGCFSLRLHIADDRGRIAGIRRDQMRDIAAEGAAIPQPHWGDADALTEHLLGRHVERPGHAATHIGPVAVGLRERDRRIVNKDRPN